MQSNLLIPGLEHEKASPDFSRLRDAVTRTGASDRLPFLELFADPEIMQAVIGRPFACDADRIEFYYRLGYDSVAVNTGVGFQVSRRGAQDTADLSRGERSWLCDDACPILTRADFESYPWPNPELASTGPTEQTAQMLPEGMQCLLQSGGILEHVMWLTGYTRLAEALYDEPDFVQDLFDKVASIIYRSFERVIDCPAIGGVFFGEDMGFKTATMIAPEHLRKYHFPHLKRLVDLTHKHGKFFILHACGNLIEVMDDLIDYVGIDAKHSFEDAIQPVSDFKKQYGHRIGVVGGVDVDALARMDVGSIRKYTRAILEECGPGGGYALGSGNSVANYIKVENYLAMLEEGWRYRAARNA